MHSLVNCRVNKIIDKIAYFVKLNYNVAGPPGFEPGISGSEGPGFINEVSSGNHKLETLFTDDYS